MQKPTFFDKSFQKQIMYEYTTQKTTILALH